MAYEKGKRPECQGNCKILKEKVSGIYKNRPGSVYGEPNRLLQKLPAIHGSGQLGHAAIEKIKVVSRVL
jgi:hypothetical protein